MSVSSERIDLRVINQQEGSQQLSESSVTESTTTNLTQGTACAPSLIENLLQTKPKRKQVKNACVNCQKACKKCDDGRPCQRCIRYELTETCKNSIRKERRKGSRRGPYKRRTNQKDDKVSITVPTIVPIFDGQISEQLINLPAISQQILGKQVADGIGKFIIIPQSSGGISYYILMPIHQQNQTTISLINNCVSMQVKTDFEPQPEEPDRLLSEDGSRNPESVAARETYREIFPDKEKEDKSNLSVLSLVCSDLLDQDIIPYEQANKEIAENRSQYGLKATAPKQFTTSTWNSVNNGKQQVVTFESNNSFKNQVVNRSSKTQILTNTLDTPDIRATYATHKDYNDSSFKPESPKLFSIPANPIATAQYVPVKREPHVCNVKRTKHHQHEEFQSSQHGASFQIPMQQKYYEISSLTPHSAASPSNVCMVQNQTPPFYQLRYNNQQLPQQITPTSLSFAFSPDIIINTPQSQTSDYANDSASQ